MRNTARKSRASQNANSRTNYSKNTKISRDSGFIFNTPQRYGTTKSISEIFHDIIIYPTEIQEKRGENE
jgi:hypothetical protein